jgi:hypothetical protein
MTRRIRRLLVPLLCLACSEEAPPAPVDPSRGPADGIIEIDPTRIPIGENSGGMGAAAGSGPLGGGSGTGGSAGSDIGGGEAGGSDTGGSDAGGTSATGGTSGTAGASGSGGAVARGVGSPCESDADCDAPLSCRDDSIDYIAHKQCTMPCAVGGDCEAELGANTLCIGAEICVFSCGSDADCLPKTRCNSAGWCERGGPGSGIPYCGGEATPCTSLEPLDCVSSGGCTLESGCSGMPRGCSAYTSQDLCARHQGCSWISNSCGGSARSCDLFSASSTCSTQDGCAWEDRCDGMADPCESIFVQLCTAQPGCMLLE